MAEPKTNLCSIPNVKLRDLFGRPCRIVKRDTDGDVVWKGSPPKDDDESDEQDDDANPRTAPPKRQPEFVEADVPLLLQDILLTFNGSQLLRQIQRAKDGYHAQRLWIQLERSIDQDYIKLAKEQYDWLHDSLLHRHLPPDKNLKESPGERTIAAFLWGIHEHCVVSQLKSLDERDNNDLPPEKPFLLNHGTAPEAATAAVSPDGAVPVEA